MTEKQIIKDLSIYLDKRRFPYRIPNCFIYGWECDYWCLTANGESREFEIKTSRADFLKDAKKNKHKNDSGANFFYYICPTDIIKEIDIPQKYGLIYWNTAGLQLIKKPKRLNNNTFVDWQMLANKIYGRWHGLWKQKYYFEEEINEDQYHDGFNVDLFLHE